MSNTTNVLLIELFYGGSHKQLVDILVKELQPECKFSVVTLPAKKWPWRARCGALKVSELIPRGSYHILFCSSVLSLAELLGIRPDLLPLKKIVYFHENQMIYPKQKIKDRDYQYGYNQITTCMAADKIIFNSKFNMESFLVNINKFIKLMPDCRPTNIRSQIESKCSVMYFPINFPMVEKVERTFDVLHIVWPHRWEFDKGPEIFFNVLYKLKENNMNFKLSILGEVFQDVPHIFYEAKMKLEEHILHWGFVEKKETYYKILSSAHVVISTAKHEFYGVAMLEAVHCGCFPIVPNMLVYPEIYKGSCLYRNDKELFTLLNSLCQNPSRVKEMMVNTKMDLRKFSKEELIPNYKLLLTK